MATRKRGAKRRKSAHKRKASSRTPSTHVVLVENPKGTRMARKRRKGGKRRHSKKTNPAPARHRRRHTFKAKARKRHHRRRNPGGPLVNVLLAVGLGAAGLIGGNMLAAEAQKLSPSITPTIANAGRVALGVGLGAMLAKKHGAIATGLAVGVAGPALFELVKPMLPASLQGFGDYPQLGAVMLPQLEAVETIDAVEFDPGF